MRLVDGGKLYYVLSGMDGKTMTPDRVMTREDADAEIKRLSQPWFDGRGIDNLRIVDFRTYPAAPTLF